MCIRDRLSTLNSPPGPKHPRAGAGRARHRDRRGLHRHRPHLRHWHETNGKARDARLRPLGFGKREGSLVRHRRRQPLQSGRRDGRWRASHLRRLGDSQCARYRARLSGIQESPTFSAFVI